MKILYTLLFISFIIPASQAQTPLTQAVDFTVKTIEGETLHLFEYLDNGQLVVIDFFSTSCGPCGEYAPEVQASFEDFGSNQGNVVYMGICWGDSNEGVAYFDSIYGVTYPTVSGFEGGGNQVINLYQIQAYPTVILIDTDGTILNQHIWEPTQENINTEVLAAGGILTSVDENYSVINSAGISIYPNPANSVTNVSLVLDKSVVADIKIFDLLGKEAYSLNEQYLEKGTNLIPLDVKNLTPAPYLVGIVSNSRLLKTKRLIISN